MADQLITAPATEPVTVAELRDHLRDAPDSDATLARYIKAARSYFEEATDLALVEQTRRLTLDAWPGGAEGDGLGWWDGVRQGAIGAGQPTALEIGRAPLIEIVSVVTTTQDGTEVTMSAAEYYADTSTKPGRIALVPGYTWPTLERATAGIAITYKAGFDPLLLPAAIPVAILEIAAHRYENRGDDAMSDAVPKSAARVIDKLRVRPGL